MESPSPSLSSISEPPQNPETPGRERGYRLFKRALVFFLCAFLVFVAYHSGYERGQQAPSKAQKGSEVLSPDNALIINTQSPDKTVDFALFWKVWALLTEKYVDGGALDARKLFYGAIDGMLAATGDPYTTFFDPQENKEFQEDVSGVFEGIGAEMGVKDEVLTIIAPLEGMPAAKAGLMAGDRVLEINGESTSTLSLEEAVNRIRGKKGSEVRLTILREGDKETRSITIQRDVIFVKSVRAETKDGNIAYIRVSRFGEDTQAAFRKAVRQALDERRQGLILDLRNNPGGFLETSIEMASLMLPPGKIIVMEEDSKGERKEIKSRGGDLISSMETIVLINEGSASASEILAGALRDNRANVTLVGKKTFGKGSVQELIPVGSDTSVKITVARWLTPAGQQINNVGINPDIAIDLSRDDLDNKRDPQLDKALEILRNKNQGER